MKERPSQSQAATPAGNGGTHEQSRSFHLLFALMLDFTRDGELFDHLEFNSHFSSFLETGTQYVRCCAPVLSNYHSFQPKERDFYFCGGFKAG